MYLLKIRSAFRDELYMNLSTLKVYGRIYVAHEGINAQVSVPEADFENFKEISLFHSHPERCTS